MTDTNSKPNSESKSQSRDLASMFAPAQGSRRKQPSSYSLTPSLTQLAVKGNLQQLRAALDEGEEEVDVQSPNGLTPLVLAAKYGRVSSVKLLIEYGASSRAAALAVAIEQGHAEIIEILQSM